jgi:hypothetical protein
LKKSDHKICSPQNLLTKICSQKSAHKRLNMYIVEERATTTQIHRCTQHINYRIHRHHHQSPLHSLSTMVTRNSIHR